MSILKRISYNSPVILTYALISMLVLILCFGTNGQTNTMLFSTYRGNLADPLYYFRLIGHVFGHVSLAHYFGNFIIILLIGPVMEEKYGSVYLLLMMLVTALVTGILNSIMFTTGLLGASGIVFMLIVLCSFANFEKGRIPLTFILIIAIYLGQEIITGVSVQDNVSHITHVIGGACGAALGFLINYFGWKKPKTKVASEPSNGMDIGIIK